MARRKGGVFFSNPNRQILCYRLQASRLPPGSEVTLQGLRKRQDLNGLAAKVDIFLPDRSIYQVREALVSAC